MIDIAKRVNPTDGIYINNIACTVGFDIIQITGPSMISKIPNILICITRFIIYLLLYLTLLMCIVDLLCISII